MNNYSTSFALDGNAPNDDDSGDETGSEVDETTGEKVRRKRKNTNHDPLRNEKMNSIQVSC